MATDTASTRHPWTLEKVLAACLVASALFYWRLLLPPMVWEWTLPLVILWVGSVEGLLRGSRRGFYFVYALVPFATVFHSVALVPGARLVLPLFDMGIRPWLMLGLNLALLGITVVAHLTSADRRGRLLLPN